jgi:hypothetical protein
MAPKRVEVSPLKKLAVAVYKGELDLLDETAGHGGRCVAAAVTISLSNRVIGSDDELLAPGLSW